MTETSDQNIETLISVTSRLINVLNSEVDLLRAMQVDEIERLQAEKRDLTLLYEEQIRIFAAQPETLGLLAPAVRAELDSLAGQLDSALSENARALNAVRESHDRLLKAIVEAVSQERSRHKGYGQDGARSLSRIEQEQAATSLTLDQTL